MYDIKALYEATSVPHAIELLLAHPEAKIIAGGSDVLVQMREGRLAGCELVSIYGLDELRGVTLEADGTIRIGSLTSFSPHYEGPHHPAAHPRAWRGGGPGRRPADPQHRHDRRQHVQRRDERADSASTLFAWDAEGRADRAGRRAPAADPGVLHQGRQGGPEARRAANGDSHPPCVLRGLSGALHQVRHAQRDGHRDHRLLRQREALRRRGRPSRTRASPMAWPGRCPCARRRRRPPCAASRSKRRRWRRLARRRSWT